MNEQSNAIYGAARVLMAAIFLVAGIRKLMTYAATAGYFGSLGLPMANLVVAFVAALEILGAVALIANWRVRDVALVLAVFTFASGFIGHRFWAAEGPQFANQLNHFLKNVAMVGGFLAIAMIATPRATRKSAAP